MVADEVENYRDLSTMASSASAVVVAEVRSAKPGRTIIGSRGDGANIPDDIVQMSEIRLDVKDVLAGELPPSTVASDGSIILEGVMGGGSTISDADQPHGQVILFLRHKGEPSDALPEERDRYSVVSSQGMWLQGPDGTMINPFLSAREQERVTDRSISNPLMSEEDRERMDSFRATEPPDPLYVQTEGMSWDEFTTVVRQAT